MIRITDLLEKINFRIPFGRWQLFEFNDLWIIPPFIKHDQQDALAARWTKKIPIIQKCSPAETVAKVLDETLKDVSNPEKDEKQCKVIDFGSGTGGPIPLIESLINTKRKDQIPFLLTDITPNLDAWIALSAKSDGLSFVPQPVDAALPPFSVISTTTRGDKDLAAKAGYEDDGRKVLRTYCSTFHHFDDIMAAKVLKSTMETSDAFVIVELQERRIGSIVLTLLEAWILFFLAIFWFWNDKTHLFFTYAVPILPVTQFLDGVVTCLRIRSFEETLDLISGDIERIDKDGSVVIRNWRFKHSRILHTWPLGYMNMITGTSMSPKTV